MVRCFRAFELFVFFALFMREGTQLFTENEKLKEELADLEDAVRLLSVFSAIFLVFVMFSSISVLC